MTSAIKPRRILFVLHAYTREGGGGATRSTRQLAETLARRGHDVHAVELVPIGDPRAFTTFTLDGVTVHPVPLRNLYWAFDKQKKPSWQRILWHVIDIFNLRALWDFDKILKQVKPDIVNSSVISGYSTSIYFAVKSNGAKLIHTLRDYYLMCPQSGMYKAGKNCEGICTGCKPFYHSRKIMAQQVDMFLSNSAFVTARHTSNRFFRAGVPTPTQWNINDLKGSGLPRERGEIFRFGYAARIDPTKGIEKLLEAADRLKHRENWELLVAGVGDESYTAALKQRFAHLSQVKWLGWMKPQDFYPQIDVQACPSTYHEPLPRVVYEGYGFGLPTLAAATGGTPEVVEEGRTGFLYDAESVTDLSALMERFLDMSAEDYTAMSAHALNKAQMFTPDAVAALYEERMESVLAG